MCRVFFFEVLKLLSLRREAVLQRLQLTEVSERQRTPGKLGKKLLKAAREVIATHRRYLQTTDDLDWLRDQLQPLRQRIQALLEQGARGQHEHAANFCAGLLEEYDALWTFCDVQNVDIH